MLDMRGTCKQSRTPNKKSDLVRAYGNGPYQNKLMHIRNDKQTLIQGPNSKHLKYAASLCQECNTTFTQPFDRAYDKFINYIYTNESSLYKNRYINFYEVYGDSFEEEQRNLYKYFVKSFGCRLIEAQQNIPSDLKDLLHLESFTTGLRINFSISKAIFFMPKEIRDGFIEKGDLEIQYSNRDSSPLSYHWMEHVSWLFIHYWYMLYPDEKLGSTWTADNQYVYLGFIPSSMNEDELIDFYKDL